MADKQKFPPTNDKAIVSRTRELFLNQMTNPGQFPSIPVHACEEGNHGIVSSVPTSSRNNLTYTVTLCKWWRWETSSGMNQA